MPATSRLIAPRTWARSERSRSPDNSALPRRLGAIADRGDHVLKLRHPLPGVAALLRVVPGEPGQLSPSGEGNQPRLSLTPDCAPKRLGFAKAYVAQPGLFHQRLYLGSGHAPLETGAEAVERVGAHRVIAAPAIGAERPVREITAKQPRALRACPQWPISAARERFTNDRVHAA